MSRTPLSFLRVIFGKFFNQKINNIFLKIGVVNLIGLMEGGVVFLSHEIRIKDIFDEKKTNKQTLFKLT